MKRSETRILTTHAGSLPRPEPLTALLGAVSRGEPVDPAALDAAANAATAAAVQAQLAAGVDIINNGEQSRISFSTYVTQRMDGFGGSWTRRGHRDQNELPYNPPYPAILPNPKPRPATIQPKPPQYTPNRLTGAALSLNMTAI